MQRLVRFEVLGQEYPLYTDATEEDVKEILDLVKNQLETYAKSSTTLPANKLAILTSLNMAGKYVKLKREFEQYKQMVVETAGLMKTKIDNSLEFK
ncbi:MAG: cell division protein ZapA [Proteobacteria bacterium]|nr:cell division protein ZapA [Pseudomonadota bacterium]MBU4295191.1 cell division protein ZapA [Pseudomonadota bacterium]MCG2749703.1 cell division protein ZapA [Desulfobulbaceae bacterium]